LIRKPRQADHGPVYTGGIRNLKAASHGRAHRLKVSLFIAGSVLVTTARCRRYDDGASSGPGRNPWYYG
jgi:hypothetical protein